jgi:hypothetical protein
MPRKSTTKSARRKRKLAGNALAVAKPPVSDGEYKVGPGRPPREFQFKPGQSGNPKGAKRKPTSMVPDLKAHLERALSGKVALIEGERERFVSKAAAGIERLVEQFAEGDRHARRDLIDLAHRLDVDLTAGHGREKALQAPASAEDQAVLADYFKRFDGAHDDTSEPQSTQSPDPSNEDGEEHD